jgi:hypothetical protein
MASFADQQVEKLQTLLSANVGVKSITVGNTAVSYDDLLKQYDYGLLTTAVSHHARFRGCQVCKGLRLFLDL